MLLVITSTFLKDSDLRKVGEKHLHNGIQYVVDDKLHYEETGRVLDTICSYLANHSN